MEHVKLITGSYKVQTRSARKPKFSMHGGRTWDLNGQDAGTHSSFRRFREELGC